MARTHTGNGVIFALVVSVLSTVLTTLVGVVPADAAELQPPDTSMRVAPAAVQPDTAFTTAQGARVEVYSSIGDLDGVLDWRPVNAYAYLVSSVPKYQYIRSTVYNALWDHHKAVLDTSTNKWRVIDPANGDQEVNNPFSPTAAFLSQLNQYDTAEERTKYITTLGNALTINDALAQGSSLAGLLDGAGVMKLCGRSDGACLLHPNTTYGLMHSKYALFSQARDSDGKLWDNVVWITSSNTNQASGGKKSNLSFAIFGDAGAYKGLLAGVWNVQLGQNVTDAFKTLSISGIQATSLDTVFYPSPRYGATKSARDIEAQFLLSQSNAKLGGVKSNCRAHLVHSLFSSYRSLVGDALVALKKDGCSVKIVLDENSLIDLTSTYFAMSEQLRSLIDTTEVANVHDKSIALSYTLGTRKVGVTFMGSANLNGTSIYSDELVMKTSNLEATAATQLQSDRLFRLAQLGTNVIPVLGVSIVPDNVILSPGDVQQLVASIVPSNATTQVVKWRSSDPRIATVDTTGRVTAVTTGSATISVVTESGALKASSLVTVGEPRVPTSISAPPVLKMTLNPPPCTLSTADITWSQNGFPLSGTVQLQYYKSDGTWANSGTPIAVTDGTATATRKTCLSHPWRLKTLGMANPEAAPIEPVAAFSTGYAQVVIVSGTVSTTPRLYAPMLSKKGLVPMAVQWKNPYGTRYPAQLRLQYYKGGEWRKKMDVTIPAGKTQHLFYPEAIGNTYKWRVIAAPGSKPSGTSAKVSSSVTIKIA